MAKHSEEVTSIVKFESVLSEAIERVRDIDSLWSAREVTWLSPKEVTQVVEARDQIKQAEKYIEAQRKGLVDPLNGVVKQVNAAAKPRKDYLSQLDAHLTAFLAATTAEARRLEAGSVEKQAKAQERKGNLQLASDIRDGAASTTLEGVSTVTKVKGRVENWAAFLKWVIKTEQWDVVEVIPAFLSAWAKLPKKSIPPGIEAYTVDEFRRT
jgi:hypothetical protein